MRLINEDNHDHNSGLTVTKDAFLNEGIAIMVSVFTSPVTRPHVGRIVGQYVSRFKNHGEEWIRYYKALLGMTRFAEVFVPVCRDLLEVHPGKMLHNQKGLIDTPTPRTVLQQWSNWPGVWDMTIDATYVPVCSIFYLCSVISQCCIVCGMVVT